MVASTKKAVQRFQKQFVFVARQYRETFAGAGKESPTFKTMRKAAAAGIGAESNDMSEEQAQQVIADTQTKYVRHLRVVLLPRPERRQKESGVAPRQLLERH